MSIVNGKPIFVPLRNIDTLSHDILHDSHAGVSVYPTMMVDSHHRQSLLYEFKREEIHRSCQRCNMSIQMKYDDRENSISVSRAFYTLGEAPSDYVDSGDNACPFVEGLAPVSGLLERHVLNR